MTNPEKVGQGTTELNGPKSYQNPLGDVTPTLPKSSRLITLLGTGVGIPEALGNSARLDKEREATNKGTRTQLRVRSDPSTLVLLLGHDGRRGRNTVLNKA